jgi:hypothetical protein
VATAQAVIAVTYGCDRNGALWPHQAGDDLAQGTLGLRLEMQQPAFPQKNPLGRV